MYFPVLGDPRVQEASSTFRWTFWKKDGLNSCVFEIHYFISKKFGLERVSYTWENIRSIY